MSRKVSWKNVEDMMNAMNHFVQQMENFNRRCDEMEKRRLGHDPKKRLKPKEQLERNKPLKFDLSFFHSFPKTARAEVSPKKENVREEEQQKSDLSNVSYVEESSPEKEKPDSDFSDVFPKEENAPEEDKQDSDFLDVSPKEENAPEEDKHGFDFSGVHPKEENVPEEEKHESDFSNVSPKEKNGLEEEKQNSEFSNVFPLKKNVQYSEEVVDFIIPIPIQTNHVLDLRTNLFQEEGNDMNPGRTSSNPNCARIGLVARARANEYYGELSMLIRVFWAEFNSWRPIELNYSQWGVFRAFWRNSCKIWTAVLIRDRTIDGRTCKNVMRY